MINLNEYINPEICTQQSPYFFKHNLMNSVHCWWILYPIWLLGKASGKTNATNYSRIAAITRQHAHIRNNRYNTYHTHTTSRLHHAFRPNTRNTFHYIATWRQLPKSSSSRSGASVPWSGTGTSAPHEKKEVNRHCLKLSISVMIYHPTIIRTYQVLGHFTSPAAKSLSLSKVLFTYVPRRLL